MDNIEAKPKISVLIGPPGVGKNTIADKINRCFDGFKCIDGDVFISKRGVGRLQNGTWDDSDRRDYLGLMAVGVAENARAGKRILIVDAMTTKWMREFFEDQVRAQGDFTLAWVHVMRNFAESEIDELIAERAAQGHPINSRAVFKKYSDAFEPIEQAHYEFINPGPQAGEAALVNAIRNLLYCLYER